MHDEDSILGSSSSRRRACARASCDLEKLAVRPSRRRDLAVRVTFDVVQPDDAARERRQRRQRTLDSALAAVCTSGEAAVVGQPDRRISSVGARDTDDVAMPRRAQIHEALVHRDAAHPAAERPFARVAADAPQDLDERFLKQLLRDRRPRDQAADQRIDRPLAEPIDRLVRPRIARAGGADQFRRQNSIP